MELLSLIYFLSLVLPFTIYAETTVDLCVLYTLGLPGSPVLKESTCQWRRCKRLSSVPPLGRYPGVANGNLLQYSCLEQNSMGRGTWWATVHGVAKWAPTERTHSVLSVQFSSVSHVRVSATPWTAAHQASLSITNSQSLLKLMSIKSGCHPAISSSVIPFSCLQSFPASGSFPVSQFFTPSGQSIGASASASVLPIYLISPPEFFPHPSK